MCALFTLCRSGTHFHTSLLLFCLVFQRKGLGDGLMGAGGHAVPAADALGVVGCAEHVHIHFTHPAARAAGGTFILIYLQPIDRDLVAQPVKGPQRAQPFTEGPVEEHRQHHDAQQDTVLPGEEPAQTGPDAIVGQRQWDSALQDPGGTEVLAEKGVPHSHLVHQCHGQDDDKKDQDHIFQINKDMEPLCAEFFCGDLVEQLLKPAKWAQKATYHPAQ